MPLVQGSSEEAISENISRLLDEGKDLDQAQAIALSIAERNKSYRTVRTYKLTDFPEEGDNLEITIRNSQYPQFPDYEWVKDIKENYPKIWDEGGTTEADEAFQYWTKYRAGNMTDGVIEWVQRREAWAARHEQDKNLPGVVSQLKWGIIGQPRGVSADNRVSRMKEIVNEEKRKVDEKRTKFVPLDQMHYEAHSTNVSAGFVTDYLMPIINSKVRHGVVYVGDYALLDVALDYLIISFSDLVLDGTQNRSPIAMYRNIFDNLNHVDLEQIIVDCVGFKGDLDFYDGLIVIEMPDGFDSSYRYMVQDHGKMNSVRRYVNGETGMKKYTMDEQQSKLAIEILTNDIADEFFASDNYRSVEVRDGGIVMEGDVSQYASAAFNDPQGAALDDLEDLLDEYDIEHGELDATIPLSRDSNRVQVASFYIEAPKVKSINTKNTNMSNLTKRMRRGERKFARTMRSAYNIKASYSHLDDAPEDVAEKFADMLDAIELTSEILREQSEKFSVFAEDFYDITPAAGRDRAQELLEYIGEFGDVYLSEELFKEYDISSWMARRTDSSIIQEINRLAMSTMQIVNKIVRERVTTLEEIADYMAYEGGWQSNRDYFSGLSYQSRRIAERLEEAAEQSDWNYEQIIGFQIDYIRSIR